jgi:hypothetical protein
MSWLCPHSSVSSLAGRSDVTERLHHEANAPDNMIRASVSRLKVYPYATRLDFNHAKQERAGQDKTGQARCQPDHFSRTWFLTEYLDAYTIQESRKWLDLTARSRAGTLVGGRIEGDCVTTPEPRIHPYIFCGATDS